MILHVDSSMTTIGAALSQWDVVSQAYRPIAFMSHKLSGAQLNWGMVEKEGFGLVHALKTFQFFLLQASITVRCFTDHSPLRFLTQVTAATPKLVRWSLAVSQHRISLEFIRGTDNVVSDFLSRVDSEPGVLSDSV
jgi:hypothetical protein